jgi:hypothetical protein
MTTRPKLTLIEGGGESPKPRIATLRDPLAGLADETWKGMLRLRGQLDGIKSSWGPETTPVERTFYIVFSKQLDEVMTIFLDDHPQLKPKPAGGGER